MDLIVEQDKNIWVMTRHVRYFLVLDIGVETAVTIKSIAEELEISINKLKRIIRKRSGFVDLKTQRPIFVFKQDILAVIDDLTPQIVMQKLLGR